MDVVSLLCGDGYYRSGDNLVYIGRSSGDVTMTNIFVIGDIVRTKTGHDMIIGFTYNDKVILEAGGISDREYFDVIGNYDDVENELTLHSEGDL